MVVVAVVVVIAVVIVFVFVVGVVLVAVVPVVVVVVVVVVVNVIVAVVEVVAVDTESPSNHPKVVQNPEFLIPFDLETPFAPQRRAIFRHRMGIESPKSDLKMR